MSPKLIEVFRSRQVLQANTPTIIELNVPTQGQLTTLIVKQVGAAAASITANVYDREDGTDLVANESSNGDDNVEAYSSEVHRIVDTVSGTGGIAKGYGLSGFYRNCDEKPEHTAFELNKLYLVVNASVAGGYDVCAVVAGIY